MKIEVEAGVIEGLLNYLSRDPAVILVGQLQQAMIDQRAKDQKSEVPPKQTTDLKVVEGEKA